MNLLDRYRNTPQLEKDNSFQCEHYIPISENKRCQHYIKGGACSRSNEFMCSEWLRVNGHTQSNRPAVDLIGDPLQASPPSKSTRNRKARTTAPSTPRTQSKQLFAAGAQTNKQPAVPCGLNDEDVKSFKKLGIEVCLKTDVGQIWLVPEYTDKERFELTPEHLALICYARLSFPNSKIVSLTQTPPTDKEVHHATKDIH